MKDVPQGYVLEVISVLGFHVEIGIMTHVIIFALVQQADS
jgi:hypothetical protein